MLYYGPDTSVTEEKSFRVNGPTKQGGFDPTQNNGFYGERIYRIADIEQVDNV